MLNKLDVMELLGCNSEYQIKLKTSGNTLGAEPEKNERQRCFIAIPSIAPLINSLEVKPEKLSHVAA